MTEESGTDTGRNGTNESEMTASGSGPRQVGVQLGEFTLLRRLGKGGMAEVWLAEQTTLKRNVALKLLRSDMMEDENYVRRFEAEGKAAAGLNHPNIVQIYTVGCEKGQHFIAQEYVHGQTLKALLQKRGPLDLPLALMIMRQVAAALQAAGERGIVHRDIKPENIMLTRKGEIKVADFGLAQLQGGERLHLTQEGVTMGTPLYMSPEQVSGQKLDQRSDIYSFGITCYHMLAGTPPFQGDNAVSVAVKHLHERPQPLMDLRPDLPPAVVQMIERMIAKSPEQRYPEAQAIVNDVRKLAKAIRTGEILEELPSEAGTAAPSFPVPRPARVLLLICAFIFTASAALGWQMRPRVPPVNPDSLGDVPRKSSARDQYLHAMFAIDDEDAFKAVIAWYPEEKLWTRRAEEQLALLYLKDRRRETEARAQLERLKSKVDPGDKQLLAEARVGEAYLDAIHNNKVQARKILQSSGDDFNTYLTESWRQLAREVRRMVADDGARNESRDEQRAP